MLKSSEKWNGRREYSGSSDRNLGDGRNSVFLHSYCPCSTKEGRQWTYSSTKIGGHALDHIHARIGNERVLKPEDTSIYFWGYDPLKRFGGISSPLLLHIIGVGNGSLTQKETKVICNEREEELAAYFRYITSCTFPNREILSSNKNLLLKLKSQPPMARKKKNFWPILRDFGFGAATTAVSLYIALRNNLKIGRPMDTNFITYPSDIGYDEQSWIRHLKILPSNSHLHQFRFIKHIGKGNHGVTFLVMQRSSPKTFCVIKASESLEESVNEARLLSHLRASEDSNVVFLHDFFIHTLGQKRMAYLILEYCNGSDLSSLLMKRNVLTAREIAIISAGICRGLSQLHKYSIVHRDIKPENILLHYPGQNSAKGNENFGTNLDKVIVKVADLGVGTQLNATHKKTIHAAGTIPFMAPEVRKYLLGGKVRYDCSCDIWAVGAIILVMALGNYEKYLCADNMSPTEMGLKIGQAIGCPLLGEIAFQALQLNPKSRPNANEMYDKIMKLSSSNLNVESTKKNTSKPLVSKL